MANFTPEQDQYLQLDQTRAYYKGVREGVQRYAHWRDGEQFVGTTGRTLKSALESIDREERELLQKYKNLSNLVL